jgi:hypothetical protein
MSQRDIKRLLAYSSVENIGIIISGLGLWLLGISMNNMVIAGSPWLERFCILSTMPFSRPFYFLVQAQWHIQQGLEILILWEGF